MSKSYVKQYVKSMNIFAQQNASRLGHAIPPRMVYCSGCFARAGNDTPCDNCVDTRRCPIPWSEVMRVR